MAYIRKKRTDSIISSTSKIFSQLIEDKEYEKAAKIVFLVVLKIGGKKGILSAIDDANSFINRQSMKQGLEAVE